jgi:hypothetical protein
MRRRRREMGDGLSPRGGSLRPLSPRAARAAEEATLGAGAGAPIARRPTIEATCTAEATGGEAVATPTAATTSTEPSRKRKRGFSTLR